MNFSYLKNDLVIFLGGRMIKPDFPFFHGYKLPEDLRETR